jgi:hypothetical protein
MDSTLKALIVKKFKNAEMDLDVGRHWIDETFVVRMTGSVERHDDQWIAPTVSIPLIPTIAFFWDRLGVDRDAAMNMLREAITQAMRFKVEETPAIKSKMDDVAAALGAVKQDLIAELPKMHRSGKTDVTDLRITVNALEPAEPVFSVA